MPMTKNDKLNDATESDDGRPLPEYSTINMLVSLCVGINFIETWLNTLENIFCDIAVPIKIIRKNALNKFLLKIPTPIFEYFKRKHQKLSTDIGGE